MTARIDRLWPSPSANLSDDEIVEGQTPGVRVNFVSSLDGAATNNGLSGGLSGPGDKRHFELLRRVCDVVLVGAGTVRAEGYGAMRVSPESVQWRLGHGMPAHPVFAIISGRLDLDPDSVIFSEAPVLPIIIASTEATGRERFVDKADVVLAGEGEHVDVAPMLSELRERGLLNILCEGGPTLFSALLDADAVDELFLTIAPRLEGGDAPRITAGDTPVRTLRLAHVLTSGDELLLRYAR